MAGKFLLDDIVKLEAKIKTCSAYFRGHQNNSWLLKKKEKKIFIKKRLVVILFVL